MSLEIIQNQRNALVALRDQQLADLNGTIGSIATCDRLLQQVVDAQIAQAAREVAESAKVQAVVETPAGSPVITLAEHHDESHAPEMLPVSKFVECDNCPFIDCERHGSCGRDTRTLYDLATGSGVG